MTWQGIIEATIFFLSLFAIFLAASMFKKCRRQANLLPWKYLIAGIIFLCFFEIFSILKTFGIYDHPYLMRIITTVILGFMLIALILVNKSGAT